MTRRTVTSMAGTTLATLLASLAAAQTTPVTTYSYEYDANGNRTKITDPLNRVTDQTYDALNRLKTQLQPAPTAGGVRPLTQYGYDGLSHLTSVTDPRNLITSYAVDGLGNQTALNSPDTGATNKTYDDAGNVKTSTDARGKTTTYTYDALNRATSITYASGTPTVFEYDGGPNGPANAVGQLSKMTDESGETRYVFDGIGRLMDKVQILGAGAGEQTFHVNYTYGKTGTANGKLVSLTYPSGNQVNTYYDNAGRITALTLNPANSAKLPDTSQTVQVLYGIGYQPFGMPVQWTWGNSSNTVPNTYVRTLDGEGRITG